MVLKEQTEGTTPILHTQHCLFSHISEGQHYRHCYTVGSMHGNAQSSERRVLDRCINPQYAWHSVTVVVLLLPLYSSFSVSPPPRLPPKQIIKLKEKGHRYVMSSV